MTMFQQVSHSSDRVMAALIAGLELEFGRGAAEGLAQRFDAEETDFHWDARSNERWLGAYEAPEDSDIELDRVAITGRIDGGYFVAVCIVDGDGSAHGMTRRRSFARRQAALQAFELQR
jgi:hypothetical protein